MPDVKADDSAVTNSTLPAKRGPLDPITRPLWRLKRPERVKILEPFYGMDVQLDRWYQRVASSGDRTYVGTLLTVATTTIGSAADLVILKTTDGNTWAISTAQIAYLKLKGGARDA